MSLMLPTGGMTLIALALRSGWMLSARRRWEAVIFAVASLALPGLMIANAARAQDRVLGELMAHNLIQATVIIPVAVLIAGWAGLGMVWARRTTLSRFWLVMSWSIAALWLLATGGLALGLHILFGA